MLLACLFGFYAIDLPDVSKLGESTRRPSITILSREGETLAAMGDVYGEPLRLAEMSKFLPQAVMATEDRRFYSHFGIDPIGLARAVFRNIASGGMRQGGSTITQQLAKVLFLKPDKTLKRKIQEAMLAFWLEYSFSKDEILTIYLNRVYLGAGTFGVDAAAQRYFGKSAREIGIYESALIAGLLKAPSRYNPVNDPELASGRTHQVLLNMVDAGYLNQADADNVDKKGRKLVDKVRSNLGPYFVGWIIEQLNSMPEIRGKDLVVTTTLDAKMQTIAEQALEVVLEAQGTRTNAGEGAVIMLHPNGAIRAMVGGRDHDQSQFNRAVMAERQPGSAFKTFVYLAALNAGFTPDSSVLDAPIKLGDWSPDNHTGQYLGEVSLLKAFADSLNTPAVRLAEKVGIRAVIATAQRLGIISPLRNDATLALGSNEVNLLEITAAYAPFANGGFAVLPYGIIEIREERGAVIFRKENETEQEPVMGAKHLEGMRRLLADVLKTGTGKAAKLDRESGGKTGTSQNYKDAWFIGYTADFVTGVWVGNDNAAPMKKVTGGTIPARIWKDIMQKAHAKLPPSPLPRLEIPEISVAPPEDSPENENENEDDLWQSLLKKLGR